MIVVRIESNGTKKEADLSALLANVVRAASKGVGDVKVHVVNNSSETQGISNVLKIDRIDFVPCSTRCFACHRPLTSGTAYLVKTPAGGEYPYGPTCVERKIPGSKHQIYPDFTRASRTPPTEGSKAKTTGVSKTRKSKAILHNVEEEYLFLRYEKLKGFAIPGFEALDEIYNEFKTHGVLSDKGRTFVGKLMERIPSTKFPGLSLENLQACYAYGHCITQAISLLPEDKRGFLQKLMVDLQTKLYLTDNQVEAANRWLSKINELPELDAASFGWVKHKTD